MLSDQAKRTIEFALNVVLRDYAEGLIVEYPPVIRGKVDAALAELAALPAVPAPEWANAPKQAMWWAVDADGKTNWWEKEPIYDSNQGFWINKDEDRIGLVLFWTDSRIDLPLSIDWRTLKQPRPGVENPQGT